MPLTILEETTFEKEVLHSRFICSLRHCESDDDFDKHLMDARAKYPKATHYCYGAKIGSNEKMGDDGEPNHSAGLQILSSIRHKKLENVSLIVIRYFGGTKLGLPRLTRTYRECAEETISVSRIKEAKKGMGVTISLSYSELDQIRYQLDRSGFQIGGIIFEDEVKVSFLGEERKIEDYLKNFKKESILSKNETTIYSEVKI